MRILHLSDTHDCHRRLRNLPEADVLAHLFDHIHRQHGLTSNGIATFSNGAIMSEDYSNLNSPNVIKLEC